MVAPPRTRAPQPSGRLRRHLDPSPGPARALARLAPACVVALVMWWLVGPVLALIVVGVAAAITVAAVASPTAGRGIERAMAAVSRVVGTS